MESVLYGLLNGILIIGILLAIIIAMFTELIPTNYKCKYYKRGKCTKIHNDCMIVFNESKCHIKDWED